MIRTKIVATMGPAVSSVDVLLRLFEAGADVCRLNFSHGSLDEHAVQLRNIRLAAEKFGHAIAVLGDLCGPKIRLGQVADIDGTGGMAIDVGDELTIQRAPIVGRDRRVSTTLSHLVDDIQVGDRIFIEDGALRFVCTKKFPDELHCTCTVGGILKSAKGINLPNTAVNVPSITDRDWECVEWAIQHDLDYLALSFVRSPQDLQLLREHLNNNQSDIPLIAKIEKAEALKEIDAIIDAADGLMVARGDLGVEIDLAQVPIVQKDLIRRCCSAGKPVIVATQMLQSMIEQPSPTRAEVSDVANAVFDGTDAIMLSGETSVGKFPLGAVHVMNHIAETTEAYLAESDNGREPTIKLKTMPLSGAIAKGVWQIVNELKSPLVVVWSQMGTTARIFSKLRLHIPVLALSSDQRALRRMALQYGILPLQMPVARDVQDLVNAIDKLVREKDLAPAGSRIVIVVGAPLGTPGTMNGVIIHTIGEAWVSSLASDAIPLGDAALGKT